MEKAATRIMMITCRIASSAPSYPNKPFLLPATAVIILRITVPVLISILYLLSLNIVTITIIGMTKANTRLLLHVNSV